MNTKTAKCECMDKKISHIESKMRDLEQSRQFDSDVLEKQKEIDLLAGRLKENENLMQHEVTDLKCQRVRKAAKNLKGTPYGISEQCRKEVMGTRQKPIPIMKKAKEQNKEAFLKERGAHSGQVFNARYEIIFVTKTLTNS
ncbi:hypothetical protein DPMN_141039 [Dreissena polymorpha]|uniref:Uncharacterized protein n=1 Tax=Dreissena polymorpha TaxID=45954 RepID=A0A9D4G8W1_DREPO|nr:hypothetical protein DPMN_141039 [Dreissena polymorpha]